MTQQRVLFVDDDANVLQGLQRMLRGQRREWDMSFVASGREALALMAKQRFDVVVSDMRMPEMDGAQLLNEVQARYPDAVRIALSGYSDRQVIMSSLGATHQYLCKPCDADTLKAAINRALGLRNLFQEEPSLKPLISRIRTLPSLPTLYLAIVKELQSPHATLKRVGQIIASDPGMTAKVLQLVNSAFFGLANRVASPGHAVQLLGLDLIQALVLSVHVFDQLAVPAGVDLQELWRHCMRVGMLAKRIAMAEGAEEQVGSEAMVAGLLHDVGKLILLTNVPEDYGRLLELARREQADLFELERLEFGATHAEVGGYLLGLWGLPDAIVEAVTYHHEPVGAESQPFSPRVAVYAAELLVHAADAEAAPGEPPPLDAEQFGPYADRLSMWQTVCVQAMEKEGETP